MPFPCSGLAVGPPNGIALPPTVAVHSATGCDSGQCRGATTIDRILAASPLLRIGAMAGADPGIRQPNPKKRVRMVVGGGELLCWNRTRSANQEKSAHRRCVST